AGCILAVLAHHGLVNAHRIFFWPTVVPVNAYPVHDALALHLVFTDYRHIVFRLAGDHTCGAAGAGIHVDGHAPGVFSRKPLRPERGQSFLVAGLAALLQLGERGLENDGPAFHGEVGLRAAERIALARLLQSYAWIGIVP